MGPYEILSAYLQQLFPSHEEGWHLELRSKERNPLETQHMSKHKIIKYLMSYNCKDQIDVGNLTFNFHSTRILV